MLDELVVVLGRAREGGEGEERGKSTACHITLVFRVAAYSLKFSIKYHAILIHQSDLSGWKQRRMCLKTSLCGTDMHYKTRLTYESTRTATTRW